MDVRRRVGLNLKRFRQELGLSQEKFAFKAGLHRNYISEFERGVRNPTILVLEEIALALGCALGQASRERAPKKGSPMTGKFMSSGKGSVPPLRSVYDVVLEFTTFWSCRFCRIVRQACSVIFSPSSRMH